MTKSKICYPPEVKIASILSRGDAYRSIGRRDYHVYDFLKNLPTISRNLLRVSKKFDDGQQKIADGQQKFADGQEVPEIRSFPVSRMSTEIIYQ